MATLSLPKPVPIAITGSRLLSFKWNSYLIPLPSQFKISNFCRKDSNFTTVQCVNLNSKKWSIIDLEKEEEEEDGDDEEVNQYCNNGFLFENKAVIAAGFLGLLITTIDPDSALAASGGRIGGKSFPSSRSSRSGSSSSYKSSSSYSSSPSYSSSSSSKSTRSSYSSSPSYSSSSSSSSDCDSLYSSTSYAPSPRVSESSGVDANEVIGIIFCIAVGITIGFLIAAYVKPLPKEQTSVIKLQVCLLGMARSLQKDLEQLAEVADTSTPEGLNYILKEATLALLRHPDFCISGCSSVIPLRKEMVWETLLSSRHHLPFPPQPDHRVTPISRRAPFFAAASAASSILWWDKRCQSFAETIYEVDVKQSFEDGEKDFDRLSIEERGKFGEETLFNVNNIKRKMSSRRQKEAGSRNEYIVITILVAAAGEQKFPSITNIADLKEALQKLGSISSSKTMAVEVLWTPQEEDDTLSEQELLEKYPLLKTLHDG